MMQSEFASALSQVAVERGVDPAVVLETIKAAMVSAYRKEYGEEEEADEIEVEIDPQTGETKLMRADKDITPAGFGRIAAQTAKQVVLQKINEAEKSAVVEEYRLKLGTIVSGNIFRVERGLVIVEIGKAHGLLPPQEQIPGEHYQVGRRIRFVVKEIQDGEKGADIILSRADASFLRQLFALEVPEINSGAVKIEAVAREAGLRSKVAVSATDERVDPVGSCVGQKGVRVQSIMDELGEERIDIIPFSADQEKFISNALSPSKVKAVELKEKERQAVVEVEESQLSLAIGRGGQNVRLAAKLTGWKIDVKGAEKIEVTDLTSFNFQPETLEALSAMGVSSPEALSSLTEPQLASLAEMSPEEMEKITLARTVLSTPPEVPIETVTTDVLDDKSV